MSNEDDVPLKQPEDNEDPFAPIQPLIHKYSGVLNSQILPRIAKFVERTEGTDTKLTVIAIFSSVLGAYLKDLIDLIWIVIGENGKNKNITHFFEPPDDESSKLVKYYETEFDEQRQKLYEYTNNTVYERLPLFCDSILDKSFHGFEEKGHSYNGLYQEFQSYFHQYPRLYNRETLFLFRSYIKHLTNDSLMFIQGLQEVVEHHEKESRKPLNSPYPTFHGFELLSPRSVLKRTKSKSHPHANLDSVAKHLTFSEVPHKRQPTMKEYMNKYTPKEKGKRSLSKNPYEENTHPQSKKKGGSRRLRSKPRKAKTRRSRMN
jgi:hypothetical protein